jgi:hypothetical protein
MTKTTKYNLGKQILSLIFLGALFLLVLLYGSFLNSTITSGVRVENGERELDLLSGKVSELEMRYFEAKHGVTLTLARDLGFTDSLNQLYLSRSKTQALSLGNED